MRAPRFGLRREYAIEAGEGVAAGEGDREPFFDEGLLDERAARRDERRKAPMAVGLVRN